MRQLVQGYDELRVRIERHDPGSYRVHASTRSAEASTTFTMPFNELEVENFILKVSRPRGRRRIDTSALGDARRFGGGLFKALFRENVYSLYRDVRAQARSRDWGVRITLALNGAPELIDIPWEYLFDDPDFLSVSMFTPVVRYLDLPRAPRPLLVAPPLRLLGVVSSPADYERLDVDRERRNLERALANLTAAGAVELIWLETPSLGALLRTLQTHTVHALHYIGHGTYDRDAERGVLLFEDDSGWAQPVSGEKLGMILNDFSSLRLAVLNACEGARTGRSDPFAGVAGSLVQRDIPAVVAMQFEISDDAAIVFANAFYQRLAAGSGVDASLTAARLAMLAERGDDIEWGTPVLFMRVADGKIFDLGHEEGSEPGLEVASAGRTPLRGGRGDTSEHAVAPDERPSRQLRDRNAAPARDRASDETHERLMAERTGKPHLTYRDADGRQLIRLLEPTESTLTIGRGEECDIRIGWDGEVSRLHAELRVVGHDWTVLDDGLSRNGSYVNGERLQGRRRLRDRNVLVVGQTAMTFRSPDRSAGYTTRPARIQGGISDADRRILVALCRPLKTNGQARPASSRAIADELGMSVPTVTKRLTELFVRFELDQLPQPEKRSRLAVAALQHGLVQVQEL